MASVEERLKILTMIQEGKLTPEEGIKLLETLETVTAPARPGPLPPAAPPPAARGAARWLRVRITDTDTGKVRVNIRLPISVVSAGMKMGARFSPEVQGLDMDALQQFIQSGATGLVADVYDDEDGEHVEVFVE
ncbi:SHOCT-like domain-containing protein [Levilinea saccharolytica]|uniref:YvlB/LiaX N-terminal domain-containing protein n=1 Tax=Levilinea saccharolytica TaxID=229921 RepID=A0A0M8JR07_9CHLR|nr:hypothetical protein [Levilinea saccharolytica]KPL87484.1 hypothetical protein ADN01_04890 [Levilinea saccharolytica]GAP19658.1 hypothetical protein LSAC_03568 [Levilinea saccharolytica]